MADNFDRDERRDVDVNDRDDYNRIAVDMDDDDRSDLLDTNEYEVVNGKAGLNISWRAVIAGVVTFIAILILSSLIGTAIGLGVPTLTSSQPFQGVGTGLMIWIVVTMIIALALAGFVAGITANRAGMVHGFLTWATSVIVLAFLVTNAVIGAFNVVGNVLGTAGSAATDVAAQVGQSVGTLVEDAAGSITENLNVDTSELDGTVQEFLADTDIPELQPGYIQGQLDEVGTDVANAGYAIIVEGQDPQQVISDLGSTIQSRIENITSELDRDAIVESLSTNTDMTEAEVEAAADNIVQSYNEATQQASELLTQAEQSLNELGQQVDQTVQQAQQTAEEVSNQASQFSLWMFLGLLVALLITTYTGHLGSRYTFPFD